MAKPGMITIFFAHSHSIWGRWTRLAKVVPKESDYNIYLVKHKKNWRPEVYQHLNLNNFGNKAISSYRKPVTMVGLCEPFVTILKAVPSQHPMGKFK